MYKNNVNNGGTAAPAADSRAETSPQNKAPGRLGRRSFMKRLGLASAALPAGALLASQSSARADSNKNSRLTDGDIAILRFLAAAEIIETDVWQQYTELALGNAAFQVALTALDGDMP